MEPIKMWRMPDGYCETFPVRDATEGVWIPISDYDSLVKERDEGRTEIELMAMAGETMNRQLAAAEKRIEQMLDVVADFYSKTQSGRYGALSSDARRARLDVLTHVFSRMGGGLISERAKELDKEEPLDG